MTSTSPLQVRPHLLDASALVKLVTPEPASDTLRAYFKANSVFLTTELCMAEALGVLKRKWLKSQLSDDEYLESAYVLLSHSTEHGPVGLAAPSLGDRPAFFASRYFALKHGVDLSDALQIHTLKRTALAAFSGALLITADEALASAARSEGILVWDCLREPAPLGGGSEQFVTAVGPRLRRVPVT